MLHRCLLNNAEFFSSGNKISDVYDGTIWRDFMAYDNASFLLHHNCYGLLLNVHWLQHTTFCRCNL